MRTAGVALVLAFLAAYLGSWTFRRELGIVRPAANLRYFYYHDDERVDRALYILFWPCYRLTPDWIHTGDRTFPRPEDMAP